MSIIFNKCFLDGEFPSSFKKSIVIPLYKTGDKNSCNNYRPIAVTLSLAKLLEKCIKTRLISFLNEHKFFNKNQFDPRMMLCIMLLNLFMTIFT